MASPGQQNPLNTSRVDFENPAVAPLARRVEVDPAIYSQDGELLFVKEYRHSSTTDKGRATHWWDCNSREPLRSPPDIKDKSELASGDLFCNHVAGVDMPQVWICSAFENGQPTWEPITEGMDGPDGRKLLINPKTKMPLWVKVQWSVKQMAN
ncbi:hypothetical protein FKP32DRAFT_1607326 [Trametes sanguinea]|nr:hypothetical protein FKP32DRAFT_1607326 [Trametes sanguinea]